MCLMLSVSLPADKKEGDVSDVELVLSDDDASGRPVPSIPS